MTSKLPTPSSVTRLPQLSRCGAPTRQSIKRQLSSQTIGSPEKKSRLGRGSSDGSCESLDDKVMPCPSKRPPKAAVGRLRRSVSMASIPPPSRRATVIQRGGFTRPNVAPGLSSRASSVATLQKNRNVTAANTRTPVSNITNRVNNGARTVTKAISDPKPTQDTATKGKSKRAPWDLKGRLVDMEQILKQNCSKISDYDARMASLEAEKHTLSRNLEQTQSHSASVQEEIDGLRNQLRNEKNDRMVEKAELEQKLETLEEQKSRYERLNKNLETQLDAKTQEAEGLKASVAQLVSFKAGIEAEFASTKLMLDSKTKRVQELELLTSDQEVKIGALTQDKMEAETERRRLHNIIQELKGNIRVFCRVRPLTKAEETNFGSDAIHHINFLDEKSLELVKGGNLDGSSVSGLRNRNNNYDFSFDRVFSPSESQAGVFEEVSQLVQSALDGYNVCVFAYGQTGSGKTFTMEGVYEDEQLEGMIPRTVKKIFATMEDLRGKGWTYTVEASFLEIYNESIRDLLASPKEIKNNQYEIKLIDGKKQDIYVTNLKVVPVENASRIHHLLAVAQQHRAVAATNVNERSSRSHSVFQLRLKGRNSRTDEACQGTLSLVDLAGSERLKDSGSEGARLTETQSINKSLANLGNVIMALGQKQSHIPYRNSKLTHLLQNSLGGNSKTLMLVNVSPLDSNFNESLNSLRFATKVNQCHIGTAVKQIRK